VTTFYRREGVVTSGGVVIFNKKDYFFIDFFDGFCKKYTRGLKSGQRVAF
jgi:hypothetical protein